MKKGKMKFLAVSFLIATTAPAANPAKGQTTEELQSQLDVLKLESEISKLKSEMLAAKIEPITSLAGDDSTTIADNAGVIETNMMIMRLAKAAALAMKNKIPDHQLIVAGNEELDLSEAVAFQAKLEDMSRRIKFFAAFHGIDIATPANQQNFFIQSPIATVLPVISAALRSETKISGIPLKDISGVVADQVAAEKQGIRPDKIVISSSQGSWWKQLELLQFNAEYLRNCLAISLPNFCGAMSDNHKSHLKSILSVYDKFWANYFTPTAAGKLRIASAMRQLQLKETLETKGTYIRVFASGGGSTITVKNLWTALGASGAKVSSGVSIRFLQANATTGVVTMHGQVQCAAAPKSFRNLKSFVINKVNMACHQDYQ